jgi:hypothetical protein
LQTSLEGQLPAPLTFVHAVVLAAGWQTWQPLFAVAFGA